MSPNLPLVSQKTHPAAGIHDFAMCLRGHAIVSNFSSPKVGKTFFFKKKLASLLSSLLHTVVCIGCYARLFFTSLKECRSPNCPTTDVFCCSNISRPPLFSHRTKFIKQYRRGDASFRFNIFLHIISEQHACNSTSVFYVSVSLLVVTVFFAGTYKTLATHFCNAL